ncbi:MAG: HAD family phosphatase [Patescibacteria group bacterium]|nr:HAD family phosphatase [Patescibacteria group bacterium]MCL5095684.1 HAD family phosphatase [Patescibacteria group bacterium]
MIKAIIFDFHDTIIKNGLNPIVKREKILSLEIWQPFWRGETSEKQFWQKWAQELGKDIKWEEKTRQEYYLQSIPVEGILSLVKKLRPKYKLGLLGNCPKAFLEDAVNRFSLDKYFDMMICSGETGLMKPDPEIYLLICQKLGVIPRECLYIDDDKIKLEAAINLGMKGILFKKTPQLTVELKNEKYL